MMFARSSSSSSYFTLVLVVVVIQSLTHWTVPGVEGCLCHVIPNFVCPPPPHCCESGQYAKDECGCCLTCAKAELQPCGGPNGKEGHCASGLQCLKTCSKTYLHNELHILTGCSLLAAKNITSSVPFV